MKKTLLSVGLVAALLGPFIALSTGADDARAAKPCARRKFETKQYADACKKGGQDQAKKVAKEFLKQVKKKRPDVGCATCHAKVGGDYPLKQVGLKLFKELGGI